MANINIDIKISKKVLFYGLLFFMIVEPVILYTKLKDEYLSTKAVFCFIYAFILLLLIVGSNSVKDIKKKSCIFVISLIFLIIILLNILSFIFSPYINSKTSPKIFNYLLFGALGRNEGIFVWIINFIFLLSGYFAINNFKEIKIFLKVCILMANVVAFDGLLQFLFGKDILFLWAHQIKKFEYCFSLLGNQNYVGNFLSLLIPISLGIYLIIENKHNYIQLIYYYLSVIIQFACLICSRTRGAWIAVGLSLILLAVLSIKFSYRSYYKKIIFIIVGFVAAFIVINHVSGGAIYTRATTLTTSVSSALSGDQTAGAKRMFLWINTIKYIGKRPVLGWGTNSMSLFFKLSTSVAMKNWGKPNIVVDKAHNEYLQIASTTGVPTLFLYIVMLVLVFVYALRNINKLYLLNNMYILMMITSIIGYSIAIFFNFSLLTYSTWFFMIIGVLLRLIYITKTIQLEKGALNEK